MGLFHEYDIRGIYGEELTEDFAYELSKRILEFTKAKKVVIGYDSRKGNLKLFSAFAKGFLENGIDITHIGIVSRPMLNWVAWKYKYDLGVIITASHNPKEYNGFKFLWRNAPLCYHNGLNEIEELMGKPAKAPKKKITAKKQGKIMSIDYIDDYVRFLSNHLSKDYRAFIKKHPLKIVADSSNGATGEIVKRFLFANDITYELLFTNPDGTFYGHSPNPLDPGATIVLSRKVREFSADFGIILDADGDRIRFVDDKGQNIDNNYIDALIVKDILKHDKKSSVVHDVISRKILSETITKNKGVSVVSKVGTSNIIENMISEKAIFGSEVSGHRYFRSMNNQDSGMMTLVYLLNTLSDKENTGKRLSSLWKRFDKYIDLGELNYKVADDAKKHQILDDVLSYYTKNAKKVGISKIYNIDGINALGKDYWFTLRPSNTEPLLRLRIEGKDTKKLLIAKRQLEKFIMEKR